jgi:CheY-like chemotaxis protein
VATPKKTILVVDDEEVIRYIITRILTEDGYRVLTARDGVEALRILEQSTDSVDLLLTDLMMPGMTGEQLARCASGMLPAPRFLFVSGYFPARSERALPGPLLPKPFSRTALLAAVRQLVTSAVP